MKLSLPLTVSLASMSSFLPSCFGEYIYLEGQPDGLFSLKPADPGMTLYNYETWKKANETDPEGRFKRQYSQSYEDRVVTTGIISKGDDDDDILLLPKHKEYERFEKQINELEFMSVDFDYTATKMAGTKKNMTKALEETSTDGIVVLWKGEIVYEKYFNFTCGGKECEPKFSASTPHNIKSCTKSYVGLMVSMLILEGKIDETKTIGEYIEELNEPGGAFKEKTVRQVLDMTAQFTYMEGGLGEDENGTYFFPATCDITNDANWATYFEKLWRDDVTQVGIKMPNQRNCEQLHDFNAAWPLREPPEVWRNRTGNRFVRYPGAQNHRDGLLPLKDNDYPNDKYFVYRTANTLVLAWLVEKITGVDPKDHFSKELWSKIGASRDAGIWTDSPGGFAYFGGGVSVTARDAARFGHMMNNDGQNAFNHQVIPKEIIDDIKRGGTDENRLQFGQTSVPTNNFWYNCFAATTEMKTQGCFVDPQQSKDLPSIQYLKTMGVDLEKDPYPSGFFSYRNQYWVAQDHLFFQQGIYGQYVAVFPKIDLVIAKFSSSVEENDQIFPNLSLLWAFADKFAAESDETKKSVGCSCLPTLFGHLLLLAISYIYL